MNACISKPRSSRTLVAAALTPSSVRAVTDVSAACWLFMRKLCHKWLATFNNST